MISVIVSSYQPGLFASFSNIARATIGKVPFEIIQVYNPGTMGLAKAYNKGAAKAKYPYLCFVHEDVLFETNGWGQKIIDHFTNDSRLGLIGIAGSRYKPYVYSGFGSAWGNAGLRMNIIQTIDGQRQHIIRKGYDKDIEPVIVLDGCFLCTTAAVFASVKFDENSFTGFHCYDMDFSLLVGRHYTIAVIYDVVLEHLSTGRFDRHWLADTFALHRKWNRELPQSIQPLSDKELYEQEAGAWYFLLKSVLQLKYGLKQFAQINFSKKFIRMVGLKYWLWMQAKLPLNILRSYARGVAD